MTEADVLRQLKAHVSKFRYVSEAARDLGISQQLLEMTLKGRRRIGRAVAAALGYRPVARYEKVTRARDARRKRR